MKQEIRKSVIWGRLFALALTAFLIALLFSCKAKQKIVDSSIRIDSVGISSASASATYRLADSLQRNIQLSVESMVIDDILCDNMLSLLGSVASNRNTAKVDSNYASSNGALPHIGRITLGNVKIELLEQCASSLQVEKNDTCYTQKSVDVLANTTETETRKAKPSVVWIVIVILLLLAIAVAIAYWYKKKSK